MFISYDDIVFQIMKLDSWLREATYTADWSTFLYWHHVIEVTCVLNDDATNAETFPILGGGVLRVPTNPPLSAKTWQGNVKEIAKGKLKVQGKVTAGDGQFALDDIRAAGLPLIDGADLSDVKGKVYGGGSIGSPGVYKDLQITQNVPVPSIGDDFELRDPISSGVGKGGPGPLPDSLIRRSKKTTAKKVFIRRPVADFTNGVPFQRDSHTIPTTDRELRGRLMRPRRSLKVWMLTGINGAKDYILVSPQQGAESDCKSGPICSIMNNTEVIGQMTSVMQLKFETWEGPAIQYGTVSSSGTSLSSGALGGSVSSLKGAGKRAGNVVGNQVGGLVNQGVAVQKAVPLDQAKVVTTPPVLSHRWEMSFGWDKENYLRTRNISGEVLFRGDVLGLNKLSADQLRPYFMAHLVPNGFIRVPDDGEMVKVNTEGLGIQYKITDKEVMMNFPGGRRWGLVNMEAVTEYDYHGYDSTT